MLQDVIMGLEQNPANLLPIVMETAKGWRERTTKYLADDYDTPDGTCIRDYVHVSDLARAHTLASGASGSREKEVSQLTSGARRVFP
jgi:UDP-glucose 4-epimerase